MKRMHLVGQIFGRLKVVQFSHIDASGNSIFDCICDCGALRKVRGGGLTGKRPTKSCGCLSRALSSIRNKRHGDTVGGKPTPEWEAWNGMFDRCYNHRNPSFNRYGGRGIRVCRRWRKFENFLADMGRRPDGKSLDRKNNNGNYTARNCHWATPSQQIRNRSNTILSPSKVRHIRRLALSGMNNAAIGRRLSLPRRHVSAVVNRKIWADIN